MIAGNGVGVLPVGFTKFPEPPDGAFDHGAVDNRSGNDDFQPDAIVIRAVEPERLMDLGRGIAQNL